jgi:hypothetical protein
MGAAVDISLILFVESQGSIEEAKTAAEEYKQAMELGTANKRDRNRMKKRVLVSGFSSNLPTS